MFSAWFAAAQEVAHQNTAPNDIEMVAIGDGSLSSGHKTAFRIYEAHDGNKGQVIHVGFDSVRAAKRQIKEWLKVTRNVTSRQKNHTIGSQLINDRISTLEDLPNSDKKEFMIIRRDGLICYLIESPSLQVATQIEGLIEHHR